MLELALDKQGDPQAVQRDVQPTVYLDHWALRKLSQDSGLAARFITALKVRGGTLALSWVNLLEFSQVASKRQADSADVFIDSSLPQIFFLEVDPFVVIGREDDLLGGRRGTVPHGDQHFLREFFNWRPTSVNPFTARGLLKAVQQPSLAENIKQLGDTGIARISDLRDNLESDPEFLMAVKRRPSGPKLQRGTRFILRELVRHFFLDKRMKITRNHVIDFFHAVVPLAYCDYVLLDKHWKDQADRLKARFKKAKMTVPLAMVFSEKANGVDKFLSEFEQGRCGSDTRTKTRCRRKAKGSSLFCWQHAR